MTASITPNTYTELMVAFSVVAVLVVGGVLLTALRATRDAKRLERLIEKSGFDDDLRG